MPIKPENRHLYPPNWREISALIRARAGGRCEWCGAAEGIPHLPREKEGEIRGDKCGSATDF